MRLIIDTFKKTGTLHHAYVLEGDAEIIRPELLAFIEHDLGESVQGNPDFWHARFETLSIDDARMLRERQANKAFASGQNETGQAGQAARKIFIIETRFINVEAQNALLKVFEEPTAGTHFFIITPSADIFLPTLRSRVVVVKRLGDEGFAAKSDTKSGARSGTNAHDTAKEFLAATPAERLVLEARIIEDKEKGVAADFINELIKTLRVRVAPEADPALFSELLQCREYITDRGASLKLILEHVALITPVLP